MAHVHELLHSVEEDTLVQSDGKPSGTDESPSTPLGRELDRAQSALTMDDLQFQPRQGPESLDGYLHTAGQARGFSGLKTTLRTHLIPADVNGILQESKLATYLADLVTDYCIPRERRVAAYAEMATTGSSVAFNELRREAIELFVDSETSGEAGELLLYLLTERVLGAPQILSKMSLKTAKAMHYHGADGVHARKTEGGLALYWGESKVHANRTAAIRDCLNSVSAFLTDPDRKTAARDLGLVRDNLDVEGQELRNEVVRFFIQKNPEWNRLEMRATCLIGFDLDSYPAYVDSAEIIEGEEILDSIEDWAIHLDENIRSRHLEKFDIDFFMVPFRSVSEFRVLALSAMGVS